MEIWTPLISLEKTIEMVDSRKKLSIEDRIRISSRPYHTSLADSIGNLNNSELNEVYYLEAKNIFAFCNVVYNVLKETEIVMKAIPRELSAALNYSTNNFTVANFLPLTRFLLCAPSPNKDLKPYFEGKVPKKTFAFRQMDAEQWLNNYALYSLLVCDYILEQGGVDEAMAYLFASTAWYLNKSQPFKYHSKSSDRNLDDSIYRVINDFFQQIGGNNLYIKSSCFAPLYKDL